MVLMSGMSSGGKTSHGDRTTLVFADPDKGENRLPRVSGNLATAEKFQISPVILHEFPRCFVAAQPTFR